MLACVFLDAGDSEHQLPPRPKRCGPSSRPARASGTMSHLHSVAMIKHSDNSNLEKLDHQLDCRPPWQESHGSRNLQQLTASIVESRDQDWSEGFA